MSKTLFKYNDIRSIARTGNHKNSKVSESLKLVPYRDVSWMAIGSNSCSVIIIIQSSGRTDRINGTGRSIAVLYTAGVRR